MKRITSIILLILTVCSIASAQTNAPFNAADLKLSWQVVEDNYGKAGGSRAVLSLTNTGSTPIPAKGWKIIFNVGGASNAGNDKNLLIEQINGDVFKIYAGADFKTIAPGAAIKSDIATRRIKDVTDLPTGFFIVFDNDLYKGFKLTTDIGSPLVRTESEKVLAEKIYKQNENIQDIPVASLPPVFPTPVSFTKQAGMFNFNPTVKIVTNPLFINEANYLKAEAAKLLGKPLSIGFADQHNVIVLALDKSIAAEGYTLQVSPQKVQISASGSAGIFYGIQSLKTLLPANSWAKQQQAIAIPAVNISDAPRFGHRAFMMDIGRNFLKKETVLKLIDLLSLYKLNVLHMHLNDDEGWRIEIPGLPELTQVGSKRGNTPDELTNILPSYGSGPDTAGHSGSGFYSRADYIEILKYAASHHIKVIPELETPGHARAAIKSMDARYARLLKEGNKAEAEKYLLRDLDDKSVYRSVQGWNDNVINVGLPSAYAFLTKVTDELIAMYKEADAPLETIHFGGDEVPAGVWQKSPVIADLLKRDTSIKGIDEMWHYYFSNIITMLKARNLYLSGWEEIGLMKAVVNGKRINVIDPRYAGQNVHTDVWNNLAGAEDLAYRLANAGYKVVLTNVTNLYLDLAYNESYYERGQYWGGYVDINKPFKFNPYNYYKDQKEDQAGKPLPAGYFDSKESLTEAGKANITGIQAPLWSEKITDPGKFEYLLLPKLFGVAERAWAADPAWANEPDTTKSKLLYDAAWSIFTNKVGKTELQRVDNYAGGFGYRIPTAGITSSNGTTSANVQLPGLTIRYTTDGTEPTVNSPILKSSIPISQTLNVRVFNSAGRGGRTVKLENNSPDANKQIN